jgi:4-azaleucine resistance transporter AzlC
MTSTPPRSSDVREEARAEFWAGVRAQLPLLLGVVPFGLIFGALAVTAGLSPFEAQGFSWFVFAGSAQFISIRLIEQAAPAMVVILTILVVNLRHALYSASLAPHVAHLPGRWKVVLSWLLTDEMFAVASARYQQPDRRLAHWYTLGTGLALWAAWQASTAAGILVGANVPSAWALDFALPLTFLALLVPNITDRPSLAAALAGALLSVLLTGLPYRLGLVISGLLAVGVGLLFERLRDIGHGAAEPAP